MQTTDDTILQTLINQPQSVSFFQAVRLLEQFIYTTTGVSNSSGHEYTVKNELIRFQANPSLQFPASELSDSAISLSGEGLQQLQVNFFGLFGPSGLLPHHYTEIILARLHRKDTSLQDFLNIFNQRMIAFFYRCFEKYHLPALYDRGKRAQQQDAFTVMLSALSGETGADTTDSATIKSESLLYYLDYFAKQPRSASNLSMLLSDYFDLPCYIDQCYGQWLTIPISLRSYLHSKKGKQGYNQLGVSTIIGSSTWDIQNAFVICIGPISHQAFMALLPNQSRLQRLIELTKRYIGCHLNFLIRLELIKEEVPMCQLGGDIYLSWNTWLLSQAATSNRNDTLLTQNWKH